MENRIYGTITLGVATLLYAMAFRQYKRHKYNQSLFLIILGGLLLRVFASMDFYLNEWDERYHALVAKNLLDNPFKPMLYKVPLLEYDYREWASNHVWLHKQPFPLYTMAASMWLFGKNTIALRLPSILLSTASIFATYKIGKLLSDNKTGLLAAFFCSINGLVIEHAAGRVATDHTDSFFFSLITLSVYFLLRSVQKASMPSLIIGSILIGLAILSKWLPALIVVPLWLIFSIHKITAKNILKNLLIFAGIVLIVFLPWQIYITNRFPVEAAWEYKFNVRHISENLGPHADVFYFHFNRMRIIFGELVYLPLIWLMVFSYKNLKVRNYSHLMLSVWILIPYLFFSLVATKMPGYIMPCASAIFIMTSMFFVYLESLQTKYSKLKNLTMLLLVILPIRYSIERIKPFDIRDRNPSWIQEMKNICAITEAKKAVVFNCRFPIETMFHTDMIAYETAPEPEKLRELNSKGYTIFMDNHKEVKRELMELDFVRYIKVTGHNKW